MDRFHELNAFMAVVEAGGFSAAARRTGDSQPTLSKAIGALVKRLGVALFNRSTRSVTLTDQGQRYYDRTKALVEELEDADGELTNSRVSVSGLIRISIASTFGRLHVLPLIPELLAANPGLVVDLILSDFLRDMVEDRIDLGIRVGRVNLHDAVVRRVFRTPLVCAGSRCYFEKRGIPKTPAELVDHNCLVYRGMPESAEWPFAGPQGPFNVSARGNLFSNNVDAIRAAVVGGVGIGMFKKLSVDDELANANVITVLDDFATDTRDVSLVWPKRRFVPARVSRVTDFFAKALPQRLIHDSRAGD